MRLIDAEPLIKFCTYCADDDIVKINRNTMAKMLADAPEIDAVPVVHGKWIDDNCSVCGQYVYHGDARNYCPNCGARMEGI